MRVKEVLSELGVTQNELAERLGINRVSVSRLLSDKNDMRMSTLRKIADAVGCDVIDFFRDEAVHGQQTTAPTNGIVCPHCGKPITVRLE